jgi:integrase
VTTKRRTSVNGHAGVYYRLLANGRRRYEISYVDTEGKRRWKAIGGKLEDAQAALDDIRGRKRKGERVAPTRATLAEVAAVWFESQSQLRPRTRERYALGLNGHVLPRIGRLRIAEVREEHVARVIAAMQKGLELARDEHGRLIERPRTRKQRDEHGRLVDVPMGPYAGWTIRASLTPLSLVFDYAVRRGLAGSNPVKKLERRERPQVSRREMRILDRDEIGQVLKAADARYGPLLMTAVYTGLRLGELLGLTWADVDFDAGFVRVRKQLGRDGTRVEPKTPQAVRDVVLTRQLASALREHKARSGYSLPGDFVFASQTGTAMSHRNAARRGLDRALTKAGIPHLRFHDLRHTAASLMIAEYGDQPVYVSRMLGHANPSITLTVYSHLFDGATHAEQMRARLEASHGTAVETAAGDWRRNDGGKQLPLDAEIVALEPIRGQRRTVANS